MNPAENNNLTIGFVVEPETSLVGPIDHVRHLPERMKQIVHMLQRGLRDSQGPLLIRTLRRNKLERLSLESIFSQANVFG
jgi:hypothetical protein